MVAVIERRPGRLRRLRSEISKPLVRLKPSVITSFDEELALTASRAKGTHLTETRAPMRSLTQQTDMLLAALIVLTALGMLNSQETVAFLDWLLKCSAWLLHGLTEVVALS